MSFIVGGVIDGAAIAGDGFVPGGSDSAGGRTGRVMSGVLTPEVGVVTGTGAGGTLASANGVIGAAPPGAGVRAEAGVIGAVALGEDEPGGGTLIGFDFAGM